MFETRISRDCGEADCWDYRDQMFGSKWTIEDMLWHNNHIFRDASLTSSFWIALTMAHPLHCQTWARVITWYFHQVDTWHMQGEGQHHLASDQCISYDMLIFHGQSDESSQLPILTSESLAANSLVLSSCELLLNCSLCIICGLGHFLSVAKKIKKKP